MVNNDAVVPLTRKLFYRYCLHSECGYYDIIASRGCPMSCTYCCNSIFHKIYRNKGNILRYRSVEHVISELKYVTDNFPEVKFFNIHDDAFGAASEGYIYSFCKAYKEKIGLPFHIRIIPTMINERKIALLKDAGLFSGVMGLQGSDRMNLEIYKRPTTRRSFIDVANILHKNKVIGRYDVIIDNPYSSEEDEVEAIKTFTKIPKPYSLVVYSLAFFPFTELSKKAMEDGKYDPASSGYEYQYGYPDKHRFPVLARIIEMTPWTPVPFINIFLKIRNSSLGKFLIFKYHRYIFRLEVRLISLIRKDTNRLVFLRDLLFKTCP